MPLQETGQMFKSVNWSPFYPIHLNAGFWTTPREQRIRHTVQPVVTLVAESCSVDDAKVQTVLFIELIKSTCATVVPNSTVLLISRRGRSLNILMLSLNMYP